MNILINPENERWGNVSFESTYYSSVIDYDLCFLIVSVVAPKMMRTPMSKMPLMVALDENSPKQHVPLTVRSELQNRKHITRDFSLSLNPESQKQS